jgi:hypothetical protein
MARRRLPLRPAKENRDCSERAWAGPGEVVAFGVGDGAAGPGCAALSGLPWESISPRGRHGQTV